MIQPALRDDALLADIATAAPEFGQACIWWLGQSGYAVKTHRHLLYIDLYLSEHLTAKYAATDKPHIRMTEAPLRGGQIANASYVFASHKHSDHLDPGTLPGLLAASPHAVVILPAAIVDHALAQGIPRDRLLSTSGDQTHAIDDSFLFASIPAAHPTFEQTPAGDYPFVGYCIHVDGVRLYHSGDTLVYDGLARRLRDFAPHILFLPVNGTDERRNALHVPPNMSAQEAVALAHEVGSGLVIPHHYDMFTFNTVDIAEFTRPADAASVRYAVLQPAARFDFKP
jgi:L-ascorbate metabolism protein UlaG (beta-lactamase superfamily)